MELSCVACGLKKPESAFPWRSKALGIRRKQCRECQREYNRQYHLQRAAENRTALQSLLVGCACELCLEHDYRALCFVSIADARQIDMPKEGWTHEMALDKAASITVTCLNCYAKFGHTELIQECTPWVEANDTYDLEPKTEPPSEPTDHLPGTPERVDVMRQRYDRGEPVINKEDAKPCLD